MSKYNYTVKLSNRRTMSIKILEDNSIQVNCFWRTTKGQIERFLQEKSSWIDRNLEKNNAKNERLADIISYKQILVYGKQVPLFIDGTSKATLDEVHVAKLSSLRFLYVRSFGDIFIKSFQGLAEFTSLKYN
ncbi:MAG: M48 family metallopeptidase, partial [Clostridia bacterium]|nr:M48 family metallopeptidase [Clostridia bacterium]